MVWKYHLLLPFPTFCIGEFYKNTYSYSISYASCFAIILTKNKFYCSPTASHAAFFQTHYFASISLHFCGVCAGQKKESTKNQTKKVNVTWHDSNDKDIICHLDAAVSLISYLFEPCFPWASLCSFWDSFDLKRWATSHLLFAQWEYKNMSEETLSL